jgi:hypothetical protein
MNEGELSKERDLSALCAKLGPEAALRTLVQTESGEPGPLGKMVLLYRTVQAAVHVAGGRFSASEMAGDMWDALSDSQRASLAADRDVFVARVKRWFQPSQTPASLNEAQASLLAAAATKVAQRLVGHGKIGLDERIKLPAEYGLLPTEAHVPDCLGDQVDQEFLLEWPLLSKEHNQIKKVIDDYIMADSDTSEPLYIVGEPYSGKKSILSHLIKLHKDARDPLPIFALSCAGLTYTMVGTRLAAFLGKIISRPDEVDILGNESLELIRDRAAQSPALYIFADLQVLPGNPASQLITQQNGVAELIKLLLHKNKQTRVIITCEEPRLNPQEFIPPGGFIMKVEPGNRRLIWVAPPTMQMLLEDFKGNADDELAVARLEPFRDDSVDGAALRLAATFLRIHRFQGTFERGIRDIEERLAAGTSEKENGKRLCAREIADKFWDILSPVEQLVCAAVSASEDGLRESSLSWILSELRPTIAKTETDIALQSLDLAFGNTLKREYQGALDNPARKPMEEKLFALDQLTRLAILRSIERDGGPARDLARQIHRLVAAKAREQARQRRLNVSGVYGARLTDLLRDIQAVLSLVASIDPKDLQPSTQAGTLLPTEVERAVLEGRTSGRTALRFAYLQIWQQDIDRDYRLSTEHAAEELRLHVLVAIATSIGRSFVPRRPYEVKEADLDILRLIFSDDELLEFLTSLAMAAHQAGAFEIAARAAQYVETRLTKRHVRQIILKTKLRRAHIDAMLLGRHPDLNEIETHVRDYISSISGETPTEKEARLKLYLRLGEVCYLQGNCPAGNGRTKRDEAYDAFKESVALEAEISGEDCVQRRPLISGHGARMYLRAMLDWAIKDAKGEDLTATQELLAAAKDLYALSVRRLSRHAADRAGLLLDAARLCRVEGYVKQHRHDDVAARQEYKRAQALLDSARTLVLQPGIPIAIGLDLDGLVATIGIQVAEVYDGNKQELLQQCEESAQRLRDVSDRFNLRIYQAHSRLLVFATRVAKDEERAYKDPKLLKDLEEAKGICEEINLGLYKDEISDFLAKCIR